MSNDRFRDAVARVGGGEAGRDAAVAWLARRRVSFVFLPSGEFVPNPRFSLAAGGGGAAW